MSRRRRSPGALFGVVRLGWGSALLIVPGRILRLAGGREDPMSRRVVRLLGARHALQGVAELAWWPRLASVGALADGAHAASAAGLAALDPRWRRPAALDVAVASTFCAIGWRLARRNEG